MDIKYSQGKQPKTFEREKEDENDLSSELMDTAVAHFTNTAEKGAKSTIKIATNELACGYSIFTHTHKSPVSLANRRRRTGAVRLIATGPFCYWQDDLYKNLNKGQIFPALILNIYK